MLVAVRTRTIKSENRGMNVPSFVGTIDRDTVIYFVVIPSSPLLTVIMYAVERVGSSSLVFELNVC